MIIKSSGWQEMTRRRMAKVAATKSLRVRIPLLCRGNEMITEPHAAGADSYIGEVAPATGGGATPPSDPACRSTLY